MIFYFSGTGNSKWVAKQLAEKQGEKLMSIPDALRNQTTEFFLQQKEKIGFVFPVYSWGPPSIVLKFIQKLVLHHFNANYLFFVCSCGDDVGLTKELVCEALLNRGWRCNAGFSVAMPNNYVLFPGFDVDTKLVEQRKLLAAIPAMEDINRIIGEERLEFHCHEGSMAFIKTRIINPLFVRYGISPKKFRATDACVACGRCQRVCPVNNIVLLEQKPTWGDQCTSCLACYHICPQQAVQYGNNTKGKGQYFHEK